VYEKEMHRGPLAELGDSEYSRQVKILRKEAKEKGVNYLGLIPLYASDGKTVIGEFGWGSTFSFSVRLISDENGDMVYIDGDGNVLDIDAEGNPLIIGPDGKPMAVPVSDEHKQRKK
jgi:hypothetical protein